jgi:hypothetical protein
VVWATLVWNTKKIAQLSGAREAKLNRKTLPPETLKNPVF